MKRQGEWRVKRVWRRERETTWRRERETTWWRDRAEIKEGGKKEREYGQVASEERLIDTDWGWAESEN